MAKESNIRPLANPDRDELAAAIERKIRALAILVEHADEIAAYRHKMFQAFVKAGFSEYEAREMSGDGVPYWL